MIRTKMRLDIDPRDWDKINDMAKAVINSGKWKMTSSKFLQRDLSGKTWAERNPKIVSALYRDVRKSMDKKPKKKKKLVDIFGPPSLQKKAFKENPGIKLNKDIEQLDRKVKYLYDQDKDQPVKDRAKILLDQVREKKKTYKPYIKKKKDWQSLNRLRDLERRTINLRHRKS